MPLYSVSPDHEEFELPDQEATLNEIKEIRNISSHQRGLRKKIIAIQGLGFVGSVMAAIVADCEIDGRQPYYVFGINKPTSRSFWKIPLINRGLSPLKAEDPEIDRIFKRIIEKDTIRASWVPEAYEEADIVVVDVNLDVNKPEIGKAEIALVEIDNFKKAIAEVGHRMRSDALMLIETTVPPGTCEYIVKPILEDEFRKRGIDPSIYPPLIAYSYERVMPGDGYVRSIKKMWRSYSAVNEQALTMARDFLSDIIDTVGYPLSKLQNTTATEMGKILENSYRAMNIAFIHEWTLFAEDVGINLFEVVNSIKVRKGTHDNMMYPGFGVGGYCLTKDTILAQWASKNIFNRSDELKFSIEAINVNDMMPHHTFDLLRKGVDDIRGKKIAILGASYRKDVDDTRNTPTTFLYDDIRNSGGVPIVHDPYVTKIIGRDDINITSSLSQALDGSAGVVFVVNHRSYVNMPVERLADNVKKNACIVDAFNVLDDEKIVGLKRNDFTVLGVGKGHIQYL
jgi:nucleotide sugar dehydrogenase